MKITSVLFDTYYSIKPVTKIAEDFSVDKMPPVEPIYEQRFDTYHPSAPAKTRLKKISIVDYYDINVILCRA